MKTDLISIDLQDFIKDNYSTYGRYINFERVIPGEDGLKKVHRRTLTGLREVANGKFTSTVNALGAINVRHPFAPTAVEGVLADFVRHGTIQGQGEFGVKLMEDIPHSAARYTKVNLDKKAESYFFKLVKYAPLCDGEVEIEPEYLVTPVPYCLTVGSLNLGLGVQGRTPAFTYQSLVEAYLNDDPMLLESSFGYKLDKEKSNLQSLWNFGIGNVALSMSCQRLNENEIIISGSGEIFKPDLKAFNQFTSNGSIMITNESTDKIAIRISKTPRSRVDMDEVFSVAKRVSTFNRKYNILVVRTTEQGENVIQTISIRSWLALTIQRYKDCFERYKQDKVAELELEKATYLLLPTVGKLLLEDKSDSDILASVEGLTEEILDKVKRKQVSSLRRSDFTKEIKSIEDKIKEIHSESYLKEIKKYY